MPGLLDDAAGYGRGLLDAYNNWPGLAGLLGMRPAAEQIMAANDAGKGKPLNDRGAVQAFLDSPVAMAMTTDPIRRVANPIRAYHGSPHDFEKFDLGKIGTGEGAQAYGHGLYFAENEGVARSYRDALSSDDFRLAPEINKHLPAKYAGSRDNARRIFSDIKEALQSGEIKRGVDYLKSYEVSPELAAAYKRAGELVDSNGRMYEVNLHADPQRFLDWDKPLSGQSRQVRDAIGRFGGSPQDIEAAIELYKNRINLPGPRGEMAKAELGRLEQRLFQVEGKSGSRFYNEFSDVDPEQAKQWGVTLSSPVATTRTLQQAGIPGIRYLDQGSRGAGSGTSNYVVFDPSIIEIIRKYGIAAPVATAATGGGLLGDY